MMPITYISQIFAFAVVLQSVALLIPLSLKKSSNNYELIITAGLFSQSLISLLLVLAYIRKSKKLVYACKIIFYSRQP